ncbi:MAG: 3'-5' exonuclease [Bacteroidia bacterium]|nr:MAG: 3'-5' exonuclease [Bacteroidia bacterium]
MSENIRDTQILFLDIETVTGESTFDRLSERMQNLWKKKAAPLTRDAEEDPETLYNRAAIYAEFGKIVCISVGFLAKDRTLRLKSFCGKNEKKILTEFSLLLNTHYNDDQKYLCAHNGKEFDYPYIARRMLINGIPLPRLLNISGKKPWEVRHLDTMEMWKFGDFKSYTSLELLTEIFGIPSPKTDIDGSQVSEIFWQQSDLKRITSYCEKDVTAVVQLYLSYRNKELIPEEKIICVE